MIEPSTSFTECSRIQCSSLPMSCTNVPPEHDVQHLHAAAQGEHRQIEHKCRGRHRHVELVVRGNDAVQRFLRRLLPVATRIDIAAAGQEDTIEVLQHAERIVGELVNRRNQHGHAAGSRYGTAVWLAAGECIALSLVAECQDTSADGDQRWWLAHASSIVGVNLFDVSCCPACVCYLLVTSIA